MAISRRQLSQHRKEFLSKLFDLKELVFKSAASDFLIRGTPNTVYRTCGSKSCRCNEGGDKRHGPYQVIQVVIEGKQRQIPLRKGQDNLFQAAKLYQEQMEYLKEMRLAYCELENLFLNIIEIRLKDFPHE